MKQKLTITVDPEVLVAAKRFARSRGVSLSSLIERALRDRAAVGEPSFAARWRGRFRPANRGRSPVRRPGPEAPLILIDTDVLIDVALDRQPFADPASELLDRLQTGPKRAFVAWHTLSNFYYLVTPARGGSDVRSFITDLIRFVAVADCGTDAMDFALQLGMTDFEDAMQVAAARACGARFVVTRNARDFHASPIPSVTPTEALESLF